MSRVSKSPSFGHLFQQGVKIHGGWLSLAALPNGRKISRLMLVIHKGAVLSGVRRNRFKRWLREAFRLHQSKNSLGLDAALIVSKPPEGASFQWIQEEVLKLLKNLDL